MSRLTRLARANPIFRLPHRHYAPYQWALRPFSVAATTSNRARSSSTPPPPPPPPSASSSYSAPRARNMDIRALNRMEDKNRADSDMTVDKLNQQAEDIEEELPVIADKSSIVFHDLPLREVLAGKTKFGSAIHSVGEESGIASAMELMKSLRIGAVLVTSQKHGGDVVGIISTRDFVRKVTDGADPRNGKVTEFMTESPVFAFSDDTAIACLELMQKHGFRHLPVRDRANNKMIGLVSIGDLVRVMLTNYKQSNEFLRDWINN